MIDIVYGQSKKQTETTLLAKTISKLPLTGTLYLGYPVLPTADDKIAVDALLVSLEHGTVAFRLENTVPKRDDDTAWKIVADLQDQLYFALDNNLRKHDGLRVGRKSAIEITTLTVFPTPPSVPDGVEGLYCTFDTVNEKIENLAPLPNIYLAPLQAALQKVMTIKPAKKRANIQRLDSRGAFLKRIEKEIANLDEWQKRASIESPDGPQRIRGLAGSGKTVVLALKAAYLHAQHPDWVIGVTFYSRALYQQFTDLIRRFSFEHLNDEPNWENLRVLHSWGGNDRDGVYTEIAKRAGATPRDFLYAKNVFGTSNPFDGICTELLSATESSEHQPIYDAMLIDEAQDLPPSFFQLVYRFTKTVPGKDTKRIIWAYDELQNLSNASMPSLDTLFGKDKNGKARVILSHEEGQPRQDVILPICYRNTPWALSLAHGLGFGTQREDGLVQHFDEPTLWEEVGYRVVEGSLQLGAHVVLERRAESYPVYFNENIDPADAIITQIFSDETAQADYIADCIQENLQKDELDYDDILIVLPDPYTAKRQASVIMTALRRRNIAAHLAGATSSRDELFKKESIALAHIYRSKGNEAAMVYVANCQQCYTGHELIKVRNTIFTSITRSRAWVRLLGFGSEMQRLKKEIDQITQDNFKLGFTIPTKEGLANMRKINRERTIDERRRIEKAESGLKYFLEAVRRGELSIDSLPLEMRTALANLSTKTAGEFEIPED